VTAFVVFRRARSTQDSGQLCQAPGRQQDLRRPEFSPAAQAEHVGCHPADFRLVDHPFPGYVAGWFGSGESMRWLKDVAGTLSPGQPIYVMLYALARSSSSVSSIRPLVFNSKETADNLKKERRFRSGIRPGEQTARYIDKI
jgi:hypothetical protein